MESLDQVQARLAKLAGSPAKNPRILKVDKKTLNALIAKADASGAISVEVHNDPDAIVTTETEVDPQKVAALPGDSAVASNLDDVQANFKALAERLGIHTNKLAKMLETSKNERLIKAGKAAIAEIQKALGAKAKLDQIHACFGIKKDDASDMEDHQVRWMIGDMLADLQRLATLENLIDVPAEGVDMAKSAGIAWPIDMASAKSDEPSWGADRAK